MRNLLPKFVLKQISTYVAVIVIFVNNNVLDKNLECACTTEAQVRDCSLYMVLPAVILLVLQLWIDKTAQKIWRYLCRCTCRSYCCKCKCCTGFCKFFCVLLYHSLKAVFIGLLWVVSLLIDGDWYVCCRNDQSEEHPQLACNNGPNIPADEQELLARLKNRSRVYGFCLLLGIICVATVMSLWGRKCCKERTKGNRRAVYDKLILKEERNVLKEILGKAAKDKLTQEVNRRIRGQQWESCFDAAAHLIENPSPPIIPETEETEERRSLLRTQDTRPKKSEDAEAGPSRRVTSEGHPLKEKEAACEENIESSTKV